MRCNRLLSALAALMLISGIGNDAAAQARQGQQDQAAEIERLRRELDQVRQQQPGQPLLVVPSAQPPPPPLRIDPELPMVELLPLLQRVERASGKRFLADRRLGTKIYLGTVDPNDVTYPKLLSILWMNGFAAFESEGLVKIVPENNMRFYETRLANVDDASIPPDEFVTRVLPTTNVQSAMLVPILRPLMPQAAHLAAHLDSSQLLLMDRYANIQRITAIVRALDVPARNVAAPPRN